MADKKIEKYTTCPFTGQENAWIEEELNGGKWKGRNNFDNSTITADSYEGLRLRYEKLTMSRLLSEGSGQ